MDVRVSELWVYPVKSCRGVRLTELQLEDRGPRWDRRWMLVDERNVVLSQRQLPTMALIDVAVDGDGVVARATGMDPLRIESGSSIAVERCSVWREELELAPVGAEADAWFSAVLGRRCRLMTMPAATRRRVDPAYGIWSDIVSLADAYPLLVISQQSLDDLNSRLRAAGQKAVSMQRFRPNVVVTGTRAHEEDTWHTFQLGEIACRGVKQCARCSVPAVDITTGRLGKEPLATLATYRRHEGMVWFGQYVIHDNCGRIQTGDAITVTRLTQGAQAASSSGYP